MAADLSAALAGTYYFGPSDRGRCAALVDAALAAGCKVDSYTDRWKLVVEVTPAPSTPTR